MARKNKIIEFIKNLLQVDFGGIFEVDVITYMPEDPKKIRDKITYLDTFAKPVGWEEIKGYYVLTRFEFKDGKAVFHSNTGMPLKVFFNKNTGELRFFPAKQFELEQ